MINNNNEIINLNISMKTINLYYIPKGRCLETPELITPQYEICSFKYKDIK